MALQERRMRIEVGYGLSGTLTDVAASRIIRNAIAPRFKEGNFDQGVTDGVQAIVGTLEGREPVAAGEEAAAKADTARRSPSSKGPNWHGLNASSSAPSSSASSACPP
ncbi:MAG: TPM domain-containing protein [Comamonadaceae bacterium]|nr:TPM domain-containing protein [Comamonadaceae bacterium]